MASSEELTRLSASEAVEALIRKDVRPVEMLEAVIERTERVDASVNALPTRFFEQARERAKTFEHRRPGEEDERPGWLAGLPMVAKEYNDVAGQRTTFGSPIFADNYVVESDLTVRTLEKSGGIVFAKSNVPEFAGSNTFNSVFGATRNPWDLRMTAGGSSGGAAAALASGTAWLAMGSDLGGSLRIPASYCGIVGLRPSVGRVARGSGLLPFDPLWVEGPMARNVADLALMLDAQAFQFPEDPISQPPPRRTFVEAVREARPPRRVAFSADLELSDVDAEVAGITRAACESFALAGAEMSDDKVQMAGAIEAFQVLRALLFATVRGELVGKERDRIPSHIVWNIEKGLNLTVDEILVAERTRARIVDNFRKFFERNDILVTPCVSVPPYPVEQAYPTEINGKALETYIDWMFLTFVITITGCPALSLPCGFTRSGLPVGLQIIGRPHGDAEVLAAARVLEEVLAMKSVAPIDPRDQDGMVICDGISVRSPN